MILTGSNNNMRSIAANILLFITLLIISSCNKPYHFSNMDLDGDWEFRKSGTNKWYPAEVPGTIHTDLLKNELIDDPYFGDIEKGLKWIENEKWEYKCIFQVEDSLLKYDNICIVFDGIDTHCEVRLNDSLLFTANNMFRKWKSDVKPFITQDSNILHLSFYPSVIYDSVESLKFPYKLPDQRAYTRKAPYQYGWDWGPRFVTCGVWRPVYFQIYNGAIINDVYFKPDTIDITKAKYNAIVEIEADEEIKGKLIVVDTDNSDTLTSFEVNITGGTNEIDIPFEINNPNFWWTHNTGEPFLYNISCQLLIEDKIIDKKESKLGIRTIELITDKDDIGEAFYFKLNGIPVFMKGANYIPQDNFITRIPEEKYEILIQQAVKSNMNMLRVWGGGIYEQDIFYDLCDEYGILVWQDFMFACNMYPGNPLFLENVRLEAIDNVKRLRNHACIALWCGNNEIDEGWHNWGWQNTLKYSESDSTEVWNNYRRLFHGVLPEVVDFYDSIRSYWPSSPKHGWGRKISLRDGDMHYWGVWWGKEPFEIYEDKVGRFMSEFGFQAFPPMETINSFSLPEDQQLYNNVILNHQKHPIGNELIELYMERDFVKPDSFDDFVYVSQLLQAYGISKALEAHRRAKPICMGTLYWQLNDCWPVVSWSSIDYYNRWKALHYFTSNTFKNILISTVVEDKHCKVYIVSDSLKSFTGQLFLELLNFNGTTIKNNLLEVTIPANSSKIYFNSPVSNLVSGSQLKNTLIHVSLISNDDTIATNIYYFLNPKNLNIPYNYNLKIDFELKDNGIQISLISDELIKNLFLDIVEDDGSFSDNYFDLIPGRAKKIIYKTSLDMDEVERKLEYKTLNKLN